MQITTLLAGKTLAEAWCNGTLLALRCTDGTEIQIGWRNAETGEAVKGEPVIVFAGKRIIAQRFREVPHVREVGLSR